ncbi:MAG: hypothetical protein FWF45_06360 [Coriobacteriia bacterium]|nr:hypothetical protein [Coriobacteriia bacterium]
MEIKAVLSDFSTTRVQQNLALTSLKNSNTKELAALKALSNAWQGSGGDAFRGYMQELSSEALIGVFTITSMQNKTDFAAQALNAADLNAAQSFLK